MGIIGTGERGMQDFRAFSYHEDCVFIAACDVNKLKLEPALQMMGGKVEAYGDYRRILDRKDIDAVLLTVPDHWHSPMTVEACAAGKDVYVEKPISNTLPAAQRMLDAAQKYKRVVQMGCQQRSTPHFQACAKMIQDGLLGKVTHAVLYQPGSYTRVQPPPEAPPPTLDWEMFQGPAPRKPFSPGRLFWRSYYDYGGGMLTDWGVHLTDTAHMALGCDRKGPAMTGATAQFVTVPRDNEQIPEAFACTWRYEDFVMTFTNVVPPIPAFDMQGNWFFGRKGALHVNRSGYHILPSPQRAAPPPAARGGAAGAAPAGSGPAGGAQPGRGPGGSGGQPAAPLEAKDFRNTDRGINGDTPLHARNFLDCVKSRQKPDCDIEIGFYSSLPCLLALMAIRDERSYAWDGKTAKPA
jgi:predicted dehydrogenase